MSVYLPADKNFLYIKYRDPATGEWKKKATQFRLGEEAKAFRLKADLEGAPLPPPDKYTVHGWADEWLNERSKSGISDWKNDQSRLNLHILPDIGHMLLDEVRPAHINGLIQKLRQGDKAPRTVRNVYSILRAMWRDARLRDVCQSDPCILTHRQLGKVQDKHLGWRAGAVYTRDELLMLLMSDRIPLNRRVMYGLLGLGGLRTGEVAGLRWRNVSLDQKPLGRITVVASYDRQRTKTGDERWMPVHPALSVLLYVWKMQGWAQQMGRSWTENDLVMPTPNPTNRGPRKALGSMLDRHWTWKRLQKDLVALGFRNRRAHDLRRTVISLSVEDGADENILKRGTHAPGKGIMAMYTTIAWERLCEEVAKLSLDARPPKRFGPQVRRVQVPQKV